MVNVVSLLEKPCRCVPPPVQTWVGLRLRPQLPIQPPIQPRPLCLRGQRLTQRAGPHLTWMSLYGYNRMQWARIMVRAVVLDLMRS